MKAIDRATRWAQDLEEVGFEIECETDTMFGSEFLTVRASKDGTKVYFSVRMDSKYTRFVCGSTSFYSVRRSTNQPSKMSQLVYSEIELERYRMRQASLSAS